MIYGSVCSGIEAASVAWHPLGWRAAFLSEIEPFPRAVLTHHYPDVPLHGDFTTIQAGQYAAIDVLVGGTPCQSFSIAGLRGGMADERGNLALEYLRLAQRLRPKWLVWENVPGVLSSNGGRDFGSILGGLGELGYGFAYRVLDAQYVRIHGFGRAVPQRRRRVFVVGYLGDWRRAAAVLFERESLQGHPAPSRQPGERPAPTLAARTKGGGGLGTDFDCDGGLVAKCLASTDKGHRDDPSSDNFIVSDPIAQTLTRGAESSGKGGYAGRRQEDDVNLVAYTLNAKGGGTGRTDAESETLIPCIRNGGGFDDAFAIQAGASRENPESGPDGVGIQNGHAYTLEARAEVQAVAFYVAHALRADILDASEDGTGRGTPLVPVGVALRGRDGGGTAELTGDIMTSLRTGGGGGDKPHVLLQALQSWRVRRLMPVECEKLQGFPPEYTAIPYRGKIAADGPRYRSIGNSMAVNVMRLIGHRIQMVEAVCGDGVE